MSVLKRRELPLIVVAFTLLVTVARGLRLPNEFSMTHWLFDYRFGFMKRALVGSLCAVGAFVLGVPVSASAILVLSGALTLIFLSVFLVLLIEAMRPFRMEPLVTPVALVVVSSPFVVLTGHLNGYFDALLYLLAALASVSVMAGRPGLSGLVSAAAVLTHESYLVVGLPLVLLAAYQSRPAPDRSFPGRREVLAFLPPLIAFGLVAAAVEWGDALGLRERWAERLAGFDFVSHRGRRTAELNTTAFSQFWGYQFELVGRRLVDSALLGPGLPTLATMLLLAHSGYRVRVGSPLSWLLLFGVCSPLLLHTLAWDSARISAYPIGGAVFALWILALTRPAAKPTPALWFAAAPALLVNFFGRTPLMDGEADRFASGLRALLYAPALLFTIQALRETFGTASPDPGIREDR